MRDGTLGIDRCINARNAGYEGLKLGKTEFMYDIEATVRIIAPIEVVLGGNCPSAWLHAPGTRSTEIVRKLSPDESVSAVEEPTEWSEIPANRGHWTNLQVGDRMLVRLFFAGESQPVK